MPHFLSTASLSVLAAIAIVTYAPDRSNPIASVTPSTVAAPSTLTHSASTLYSSVKNIDHATDPFEGIVDYHEIEVMEKSDLLALAPFQFLNCDVGLWSHNAFLCE